MLDEVLVQDVLETLNSLILKFNTYYTLKNMKGQR